MPHITLSSFELENSSPAELETRRRELTAQMQQFPKGYDDPDLPEEMLRELAAITMALRRKNAKPPSKATIKTRAKANIDDLI